LSFVANLPSPCALAKLQVGADLRARAGATAVEPDRVRTVAIRDNQRHVFVVTPTITPQNGYSYAVAVLDSLTFAVLHGRSVVWGLSATRGP
jgi:hypothetical protein